MDWEIEYTDEFEGWWEDLSEGEQVSLSASVKLLERFGPGLRFPHCSGIKGSRHGNLRELRVQHAGRPYRVLYAFDPRRCVLLLLGGDKTGQNRWYEEHVPLADRLYDEHLETLLKEGLDNG
ncbi:type II toxin-antitoxin system RelE/ParE family toxin [Pseudomonas sp. UMAB-08]|uniref:type II toxin-antitoxin system RelE/ParE family toxin n=1 Tax=Pseudomonas sp. UMAB-08 TaxID=1365375 RepID=UPI001C593430|nr:type II toxin-antitoxin system RelE/ParE family toxin [Pseudomonas sp. UMAB-08]